MRIRSLKPEFWRHRKTGRFSFGGKCLAIGLLNLADDEGYFEADPILIRSMLFPFNDHSLNIHGLINELSSARYIQIKKCPEEGILVGKVTNFAEHQVIQRPRASKLKAYFESLSAHVQIIEPSMQEQGTGKGRERKQSTPPNPPGGAVDDAFELFWAEILPANRKGKGRAREAFTKAIKNGATIEQIMAGAYSYRKSERKRARQNDYRPLHPTTWLNQGRWEDDFVIETESDETTLNDQIYG